MGDNGSQIENKPETQERKPIQLLITLLPDGKVNLAGPIKDRLLCYGLLEVAKELVSDLRHAKKITVPNQHGILNFARELRK